MRSLKKTQSRMDVELAETEREVEQPARSQDGKMTVEDFRKSISDMLYGKGTIERLSFDFDPRSRTDYGQIYRPKLKLLPDDVLKQVSIRDSLVAAIVMARQNHLAPFGRPQADRFSLGIDVVGDKDYVESLDESGRKAFKARCVKARDLLVTCGHTAGLQEDRQTTLSEWFEASVRSVLTVGRLATEVVYDYDEQDKEHKNPRFSHFVAADAGTIYYSARGNRQEELEAQRRSGLLELKSALGEDITIEDYLNNTNKYAYVQVIHGMKFTVFTAKEMRWRNFFPAVDIELDGYPITPIDTVIGSITTHLNIGTHNRLYFQSGRATRGMLVVQSDDVTSQQLKSIKSKFKASIDSVSNCLAGDTHISTKESGGVEVEEYLGGASERTATIWTPYGWQPGLVYRTGQKTLVETKTSNGVVHKTSPDHRFRTVNAAGELDWKRQHELAPGDTLLVNRKVVESGEPAPELMGHEITTDVAEVLGWMTGDGCLRDRQVRFYYHHAKERDIHLRHFEILTSLGFEPQFVEEEISEEERARVCARYGFKSCAATRLRIDINSSKVATAILQIGFTPSVRGADADGKSIPAWLFTATSELRYAFLRGLFSADGNNAKLRSPALTCCNHALRAQVRLLMLSLGIRTSLSEGKTKRSFSVDGRSKEYVEEPTVLRIKDRDTFFEKIGFIQDHKQPVAVKNKNRAAMKDHVPQSLALKMVRIVKDKTKLPRGGDHKHGKKSVLTVTEHLLLNEILRGERAISRPRLERICASADVALPEWFADFHFEKVVEVKQTGETVEMFDVAIYEPTHECSGLGCTSSTHGFFSNYAYLKNSWRMPIFGIGKNETIQWQQMDATGSRDMEFQYLTDMNAREIMTAFMMSPDELPGWAYLSRGTNSQALSEGNNEYKLEAARDVGIRPLCMKFEDFLNAEILPEIDPSLIGKAAVRLQGLDSDDPSKEAARIEQDAKLWLTQDGIHERVEAKPVGRKFGGSVPLSQAYQAVLWKTATVGEILAEFCGREECRDDKSLQYYADPMWFQFQQMLQEQQAAQQQAQAAAQQGPPGGGGAPPAGGDGGGGGSPDPAASGGAGSGPKPYSDAQTEGQKTAAVSSASASGQGASGGGSDLARSIDRAIGLLSKNEAKLPPELRRLLSQAKATEGWALQGLESDLLELDREIHSIAIHHAPPER